MLSTKPGNKEIIEYFFKNHKLFFCNDFPWQFHNYENSRFPRINNLNVRLDYLFSKQGFFNRMYIEHTNDNIFNEYTDYSYNFKNKRYIVQEHIQNNFFNPTHHSFKSNDINKNISIDFNNPITAMDNFSIVTHPGNTRHLSSTYLQKNLNKAFVYVHKDNYYDDMFVEKMTEIKSVDELFPYWKPFDNNSDKLEYEFVHITLPTDLSRELFMGTKIHTSTDCSILKLWKLRDLHTPDKHAVLGKNVLHTNTYMTEVNNSGKELANIIFEKKLTLYTNSNLNVKKYFLEIRNSLINKSKVIKQTYYKNKNIDYFYNEVNKYDFDVVVVDEKPNNISKLNGNKGFAIWIDKDMVEKTNREIFEFLCFTRRDVKLAETKDGKISVVNCRDIDSNIKWIIHEEFLKCGVNIDER